MFNMPNMPDDLTDREKKIFSDFLTYFWREAIIILSSHIEYIIQRQMLIFFTAFSMGLTPKDTNDFARCVVQAKREKPLADPAEILDRAKALYMEFVKNSHGNEQVSQQSESSPGR